ncbi:ethanolamine-phosphate cytidylyltransferase-like isoform X2 [Magnolia sinica]|uniref:ethanolamine-phosphate cytidylyltransferase-like isoform X2 n=1 Tax=Magnolia sinica TaxID=86752 RepID=UPI00265B3B4E|nr:ethanolamine-phosphate cytidylyltransferase-like isoform X2 [Magnolia sinica]
MGSMEFESHNWIWDGVYYPHLFGGIMITAAVLGLSTSYFGGIGVACLPYFGLDLGIFQKKRYGRRPVRVYMDGCFDLMHYGHANALRQAKALGDELVVGVVSDEEIIANKGPPVLSMEERLVLVNGLKWVDEVITNAPYEINEKFMNTLFNELKIDYIIHGDDPCLLPGGTDAYALAKKVGRYKQIKRTEGVSSTDIVGRILSSMRDRDRQSNASLPEQFHNQSTTHAEESDSNGSHVSHFLPTSRRIVQFSNGKILKHARQLGDFLLVGIHSDQTVSEHRGTHHPVMHLHERSLSVLACRYVDEVIIGAPWEVTKDMITTFNISLVVHGTVAESNPLSNGEVDPYAAPKSMGIFWMVESPRDTTTTSIAERIIANHDIYKKRNAKKEENEKRYYAEKKFVFGD